MVKEMEFYAFESSSVVKGLKRRGKWEREGDDGLEEMIDSQWGWIWGVRKKNGTKSGRGGKCGMSVS
jgi:hypothetical protein